MHEEVQKVVECLVVNRGHVGRVWHCQMLPN